MSPAGSPICPGFKTTMLGILLASGFCSCLHHYYFIHEPKTWPEAQLYCREKYTDLATIDDQEDLERLIAAAGAGYEGKVWIGLHDKPSGWSWSLSKRNFYKNREQHFRRWNNDEPNDIRSNERLCAVFHQGFWNDYACSLPFSFVCYDTDQGLGNTTIDRYIFVNQLKPWVEAQKYCRQNHRDLASVRNETENLMIQQKVPSDQYVAIGLHSQPWIWWSDGTYRTFNTWADGHPSSRNETCAAIVFNGTNHGKAVENHCDRKLHFMCQNNKTRLVSVKLTALKSTIDLNDPAVSVAIVNLMVEKMKEKGITGNFKISWIRKWDKTIFHKEEKGGEEKMDEENMASNTVPCSPRPL